MGVLAKGIGRRRTLLAVLVVALTGATAAEAGATVRVEHFTDPAGVTTPFTYTLTGSPNTGGQIEPRTVALVDGDFKGFGVTAGIYVIQASPPAGWRVASIQCTEGGRTADFQIDLANARVTVDHSRAVGEDVHHVCAFTNRRIGAASTVGSTGIAATPLITGNVPQARATRAALLGVRGRRGHALATVRLARRSVVRATLLKGSRVVATRRVVRNAGVHRIQVTLPRAQRQRLRRGGKTRDTLRLRVVVAERNGKTRVFTLGVIVRL